MNSWQEREGPVRDFIDRLRHPEVESSKLPRFNHTYPEMSFFRALRDGLRIQRERRDITWMQERWGRDYVDWLANDDLQLPIDKMIKLSEKLPVAETVLTLAEQIMKDVESWTPALSTSKYHIQKFEGLVREELGAVKT